MIEQNKRRRRGAAAKYLAFGTAAALTISGVALGMTASNADVKTLDPGVVSAAHGQGLYTSLLSANLAATAHAFSEYPDTPSDSGQLDLNALGIDVSGLLGLQNVQLPLIGTNQNPGLLDLGDLEALIATAESPSETSSIASSGVLGQGGSTVVLDPTQVPSGFEPAQLDLSMLLEQLAGNTGNAILSEGGIELGALGARVERTNGVLTDQYMVAGAELNLRSPLVASIATSLDNALRGTPDGGGVRSGGVAGTLNAAVGSGGVLDSVVGSLPNINAGILVINASGGTIALDGVDTGLAQATQTLLADPLADANGIVEIWLADTTDNGVPISGGTIRVDLEKAIAGGSLNGLAPNTLLLDATTLTRITDAVNEALGTLSSKVVTAVTDVVNNLDAKIVIPAKLYTGLNCAISIACVDATIHVDAKLGQLTGAVTGTPTVQVDAVVNGVLGSLLSLLGLNDLSALSTFVLQPVVDTLTTALSPVIGTLLSGITSALPGTLSGITTPVLSGLSPVLAVLNTIVQITLNEQPTAAPTNASGGDLGLGSFTVRALKINVLGNVLPIELGSASVLAAEPEAALVATPERVAAGEVVTLAGTHFAPSASVSITIPGVATPIAATTDGSGAFSTTWTVPAGFALGPVIITATDTASNVASDTVTVVEAALNATDAPQGGTVHVTGTDFIPGENVTITLPGGGTTVVVADLNGDISYDWPVPATQAPGTVTFTATGDSGRTASDNATITLATATLSASPNPVVPGGTVTLTGGNFAPGEAITLTLPAACAVSSGIPVVANGSGGFTVTCVADASLADGTTLSFSAVGNDSGRTASASTSVEAAPPADANTNASASAAASAQANGNNEIAAQAAAQAAAMADNSTQANAAATVNANAAASAAARASVSAGASTNASSTATASTNASAQASAQSSADSTSTSNANATSAGTAVGSVDARVASQAASDAAADGVDASATASQDATANVRANANASASASASARANGNDEAAAQAAAQAAAYSQADSDASAGATPNANSAADAAAYTAVDANVSADASTDVTSAANSAARAAAQASATASTAAQASADQNADSAADGSFDSRSAARSAAEASSAATAHAAGSADAAVDAAANVQANANASASASASADADSHSNPNAQAAAQAAAFANNDNDAQAAATPNAVAAAQAAARPNVDATASATASQNAQTQAVAAAQSTATTSANVAQAAQASATATADAEASAAAAAISNASTDASQNAAADVNASASASASAQADSNANAAAQAAAETAALANASTTATASASAAATANTVAAAQAAAETAARTNVTAVASATASQDTSADANAAANVAAQATAVTDATANTAASANARATATANSSSASEAAARQAANVDSTADASASASAAANARASVTASPSAQAASQGAANASGGQKLVNTGTAIGGLTAAAVVLLLIGSVLLISTQRRKNLV